MQHLMCVLLLKLDHAHKKVKNCCIMWLTMNMKIHIERLHILYFAIN